MQGGQVKRTFVRQSTWGFGLFVEEAVTKDELIDEYVGELIYELTARSRGHVERHRHRNYLFNLNPTLSIDSSFVGNATRYINHSKTEFNCYAKVLLVGSEQRIGIMAGRDLEAGEELLMDYGEEFFINVQSDDTSDEAQSAEEDVAQMVESEAQVCPPIGHSSDETYDEENENEGVSDLE